MLSLQSTIRKYIEDVEHLTTEALKDIVVLQSIAGQPFDDRIKEYFISRVQFCIKDTVDLFTVENVCDIQSEDSQVATDNVIEVEIDQPSNDMMSIEVKQEPDSCDDEETIENQDDALVSDATTTTTMMQNFNSEPTSVMMSGKNNGRNIDRLSMDLVDYAPITSIIPGMPHIDSEMFQSEIEIHEEKPNFTAVIKMEDEVSLPASVESDFVTEAASFESEDIKFAIGLNQPAKRFHDPVENSIESADKKRRIDQEVLLHASNKATNGIPSRFGGRKIMFVCYDCHKTAESENHQNTEFDLFDEIENLQAHWMVNHASQKLRFFAIGVAACFRCDKVDTFQNLQKHHQNHHETEKFVVVDQKSRSNCGLCQKYIACQTAMAEHFERDHHPYSFSKVFNPICFTQKEMDWLVKLKPYENLDKSSSLTELQCGFCQKPVQNDVKSGVLRRHVESHTFLFNCCGFCNFKTEYADELISYAESTHPGDQRKRLEVEFRDSLKRIYLRTKLVFSNGLVVFNHNVLKTNFDDSNDFVPFVTRFANEKFDYNKKQIIENQMRFRNMLYISGADFSSTKENVKSFFLSLCQEIKVNVTKKDIYRIQDDDGKSFVVELKDLNKRKEIQTAWRKYQSTGHFKAKLKAFRKKLDVTNLSMEVHLSNFFKELWFEAETAKRKKQIDSFWFSINGLNVKVLPTSKEEIIWSKFDLMKLISRGC